MVKYSSYSGATDRNEAKMLKFVESFNKSKLGEYIANLSEEGKRNLGQRYLTDFILMTIDISSCDELKVSLFFLNSFYIYFKKSFMNESGN